MSVEKNPELQENSVQKDNGILAERPLRALPHSLLYDVTLGEQKVSNVANELLETCNKGWAANAFLSAPCYQPGEKNAFIEIFTLKGVSSDNSKKQRYTKLLLEI